ncbi:MAG: proline racemase family protein [Synergistaceae bacterium]|nr:proline racemase family protein [Synergistaceae bacterium]
MLRFERIIQCIDAHVAGEPLRIVTSGYPEIPGKTMMEKHKYAMEHLDWLRSLVMLEPRGHNDMYGCIPTPPVTEDGDLGVLFIHSEGFSTMCGHGVIGTVQILAETGRLAVSEGNNEIKVDSPAGRVKVKILCEDKIIREVSMENVYSFTLSQNIPVIIDGLGAVPVDVAFGGSFFAFVNAKDLNVEIIPENLSKLLTIGNYIRHVLSNDPGICHPDDPDIKGVYGTLICAPITEEGKTLRSKSICVQNDAGYDRCPCGTGTSARMALLNTKGILNHEMIFEHSSILGTMFKGRILTLKNGGIIPEITGIANITAFTQMVLTPGDPFPQGFRLI